jgi:FSR family fosmidomycin resistance protein-like MFS transporter
VNKPPGFVLLLFTANIPIAFVAVVILGVGLYLPFSVQVTLGQDYLPTEIGTASGVTLGLAVSAGGLAAPLLGLIADHAGIRSSLALAAVLPIAVLLITTRLPETREPRYPRPRNGVRPGGRPGSVLSSAGGLEQWHDEIGEDVHAVRGQQ